MLFELEIRLNQAHYGLMALIAEKIAEKYEQMQDASPAQQRRIVHEQRHLERLHRSLSIDRLK
ncbi:hypothetical protein SAMN05421780_11075 [Flexibacter flexilis DSM 6793]|uniref:Uncharacterized protein n=1 Tax=Flexibacter flexilis DSM 6793 TaxID=927664 RepID=A0A1I1MJ98_9BACT|nr:hypothetical protein SAMN05421780_11075 [Flexibacter flexilis DSM 6793]